jgi:tRNA(Arg) A34 adenosine deaminase TadA
MDIETQEKVKVEQLKLEKPQPSTVSTQVHRFLGLAMNEASKSNMYFQHGAVLFQGDQLINMGHNRVDRLRLQKSNNMLSTHAEIDCSRRLLFYPSLSKYKINPKKKIKKYSILVIRLTRGGGLCNSRPCNSCIKRLGEMGIDKVYYSIEGGTIVCEKVKYMKPKHVCAGTQYLITGIDRTQKCL